MAKKKQIEQQDIDAEVVAGFEVKENPAIESSGKMNPVTDFFNPQYNQQVISNAGADQIILGKSSVIDNKTKELEELRNQKKVIDKGFTIVHS